MQSFKIGNHTALKLSVVSLLIVITYAYGAATLSPVSSPSSLSSSSLMLSEQRKLSQQENGDFDIAPYKKNGGSKRNRGSKQNGGNKRRRGSKRNGGSKKNKWGGGKNSGNRANLNFTSSCECGKKFTKRIIGGAPATKNEYPWQAALFIGGIFDCGGTLINNRFVLTAAHCVQNEKASNVTVRLREHSLSTTDQAMEIEKSVVKIIVHKDYDEITLRNDIALLEFDQAIVFPTSASLRPICLPSTTSNLYVGDKAIATGWGQTDPSVVTLPDVLREVELKVVSEQVCKTFYADPLGGVRNTNICAGKRNKNICFGDSGGPLAYENSDTRYEQIGITSFTQECGKAKREPGVFSRVTSYLGWIKRKTKSATYCKGFTFP